MEPSSAIASETHPGSSNEASPPPTGDSSPVAPPADAEPIEMICIHSGALGWSLWSKEGLLEAPLAQTSIYSRGRPVAFIHQNPHILERYQLAVTVQAAGGVRVDIGDLLSDRGLLSVCPANEPIELEIIEA